MAWLVVAMGVLLMLVGAMSVISGAPIIQIERGWAEVISGSVAVSGGVIAFALGIVLFRLQWLHQAIAGSAVAVRTPVVLPSREPDETAPQPIPAPDDTIDLEPRPAEFRHDVRPETDHPKLWKTVPALPPSTLRPTIEPAIATAAATGLAAAADESPVRTTREPEPPPVEAPLRPEPALSRMDEPEARPRRLSFPPSERSDASDPAPRSPTLSRDWMSRPLLRPRPPQPPPSSEPPPLFAGPTGEADEDRAPAIDTPAQASDDALHEGTAPRLDVAPPRAEARSSPELAVVGRYQAGSSTYIMYSNGSIDVETEGGDTHHFTSMAELKAFIARQENTVS